AALSLLLLAGCAAPATRPAPPAAVTAPPGAATPAAVPAPPGADAPPPMAVIVRIGTLPLVSDAGIYLGIEKGYFAEEGIAIEATRFDSAAHLVAPLGTGELGVAGGSIGAGLFNAMARDVALKIVADKGSLPPGAGW